MSAPIPIRVMVHDAWDQVTLELAPDTPVAEAKRQALELTRVDGDPRAYVVKYGGGEVLDESRSLAEVGVRRNAALIVLPRRRRPVR
jgi:hypothetical protein